MERKSAFPAVPKITNRIKKPILNKNYTIAVHMLYYFKKGRRTWKSQGKAGSQGSTAPGSWSYIIGNRKSMTIEKWSILEALLRKRKKSNGSILIIYCREKLKSDAELLLYSNEKKKQEEKKRDSQEDKKMMDHLAQVEQNYAKIQAERKEKLIKTQEENLKVALKVKNDKVQKQVGDNLKEGAPVYVKGFTHENYDF